MRLDKFLKVSRIIKRRTIASEAAKDEKILVNGRLAKPSHELKVGDIITINYYKKMMEVRVKQLMASTKKDDASEMFEVIRVVENKAVE